MNQHLKLLDHLFNSAWYYDHTEGMRILPFLLNMCMGQGAAVPLMNAGFNVNPEPREKTKSFSEFIDPEQFSYHLYSGAVGKYLGFSEDGIELRNFEYDLRKFADHPTQHTFIAHIDTPGGTGYGIRPLVQLMSVIHEQTNKEIVGYTDSLCCSAGAWISAGFNQFYMDPGSKGGSYGVYSVWLNFARALEEMNVDVEFFFSGELKAAGHPYIEMTEKMRAEVKKNYESLGDEFRSAVQELRGVKIPQEYMEGQSLSAEDCVEIGVCDGIVGTLDEVIELYEE